MKHKLIIISFLIFLQSCEFNVSSAYISDAKVCTNMEKNSCDDNQISISSSTKEIFTTATLKNAPKDTKVTITWQYDNHNSWYEIDQVILRNSNENNIISSSLNAPTHGWPLGNYRIIYSLDINNSKPIIIEFSIE